MSVKCCCTIPIPSRIAVRGFSIRIGTLRKNIVPAFGCLEYSQTSRACCCKDHVSPLVVLSKCKLFPSRRIAESLRCYPGVIDHDFNLRVYRIRTCTVACLKAVQERNIHSSEKANLVRLSLQRSDCADEIGSLMSFENQRYNVRTVRFCINDCKINVR